MHIYLRLYSGKDVDYRELIIYLPKCYEGHMHTRVIIHVTKGVWMKTVHING